MPHYLHVALPVPLRDSFTYRLPAEEADASKLIGARVRVSFSGRELIGIVVRISDTCDFAPEKVLPISELIDQEPIVPGELLTLCNWGAQYYQHPLGEVINAALPQRFREGQDLEQEKIYQHTDEGKGLPHEAFARAKKQNAIHHYLLEHEVFSDDQIQELEFSKSSLKALIDKGVIEQLSRPPKIKLAPQLTSYEELFKEAPKTLNHEQENALKQVRYHNFASYLLQGTTGSGKTELYLHLIARVLQSGKQALVLIPEIGLSPQTSARIRQRFNVNIAELHSNISEGARARAWHQAKTGEARIIIGTRLSSLTPFKELGIIIIDEEHDRSFKQQEGFKYSARDISIYRAHQLKIPILLGSATPSLESIHNAKTGKYEHLILSKRAGAAKPPSIQTLDLRQQNTQSGLSERALQEIRDTLARKEQVLIFVNRRGYAPSLICHHCGWSADCLACDVRMTVHFHRRHLRCHQCDRSRSIPIKCPKCSSTDLKTSGYGTEQLEHTLMSLFPETEVIRIDRDTTRSVKSMEGKLASAHVEQACIFVGTQMLAKGHHLPHLTLVIIADADQGLLSPDFRSLEHMGQLITQVSGRAGREDKPGKVIVQSHRPEHPLLQTLLNQGYDAFAHELLLQRYSAGLPPFSYCAVFRAESKRAENCQIFLKQVKQIITQHTQGNPGLRLLGPHPAAIEKVNERFRFSLQLLCPSRAFLQKILNQSMPEINNLALGKRTRWSIDVDSVLAA